MDFVQRTRASERNRTSVAAAAVEPPPDVVDDDGNDERDSYELSFEDEQNIIDNSNDEDDDDEGATDEEDDAQNPTGEYEAITTTTMTTTTVTVADKQFSGDNPVETSSFKQVSAYFATDRRKLGGRSNSNETSAAVAALTNDIDPGAGGDSLSAIYGNTDDEFDDDDDADGMRMAQTSGRTSNSGSTTDISIHRESAVADNFNVPSGGRSNKQQNSVDNEPVTDEPHENEYANADGEPSDADEQQQSYGHHVDDGNDENEDEDNEYADLKFLQSTDDEQPAARARTPNKEQVRATTVGKLANNSSPINNKMHEEAAASDRSLRPSSKQKKMISQQIDDAESDSSSSPDSSRRRFVENEPNKNTRTITTPTNFSTMMRRRTVAAAEAEQQEQQKLQRNSTPAAESKQVGVPKITDRKSSPVDGTRKSNNQTVDGNEDERRFLTRKNSATGSTLSAMPVTATNDGTKTVQRNAANGIKVEDLAENDDELLSLSPETKMFAKHEQNAFSVAGENSNNNTNDGDNDDDYTDTLSEASTTNMPVDGPEKSSSAQASSAAKDTNFTAPVSLTPKASLFNRQLLQNIDESDDAASSTTNNQHQLKPAVPLHAVKSRRVQRPGATDSAMSSASNSRATTSSSRQPAATRNNKKSSSTEDVDETTSGAGGGDLYRQFKKLQNQYKSLQTRIQSGIKQHLQQAPGMAEELDDLDVYKRGLYDKREHERAQRLTLLEGLKVELGKATSAIERLQQAPHDARAKDGAKTTLSSLAQQLGDAREMYRSLDASLSDQARTSTSELKQCQDRLETYVKRVAQDVAQHEQQQNITKLNDRKHAPGVVTHKQENSDTKVGTKAHQRPVKTNGDAHSPSKTLILSTTGVHSSSKSILASASAGAIQSNESSGDAKTKTRHATKTSASDESAVPRPPLRSSNKKAINGTGKVDVAPKTQADASTKKSRIQTRLAKGDLPDAVFEYRNFLEHNGGRNGVGWTELEHKAYLAARTKRLAFAPTPTGGDGDVGADPNSVSWDNDLANAMPINDERFYSDLAKELMIKTSQQVREHDEWYAHVQRLDAAQKQAIKAQKDAKRLLQEKKQKQIKEQQARQRLMAQKLREQAMQKWHEQTKHQVEQWRARKTEQDKQKEDEKKLEKLVKKERQTKMRQKHDHIKQKVLEYRQQKEQEAAAERERQQQEEQEERKQRAQQANKFLKLSANKSIQSVQQQRQRSKTIVEQRRAEQEERLQKLRNKVSVNVERDPQRLLEQTTAWKRRTAAGAAATVDKTNSVSAKSKKKSIVPNKGGGGDAEQQQTAAASSSSESDTDDAESSSAESSTDDEDEDDDEKNPEKSKAKPAMHNAPSFPQPKSKAVSQKPTKSQPVVVPLASSPQKKAALRPFVAGGLVKKTVVTTRTTTVKLG